MKIINCWFGVPYPEPFIVSLPNLKRSEAGSQKTAGSIGSEVRTQRLSLRLSLIFLFLLLTSNFSLPIYGQVWADQVDTLRPGEEGGQQQWFENPSVDSAFKNIDDVVIDLDTTYLYTTDVSQWQGWRHGTFGTSNTIDSVRLVIKARSTATSGSPQLTFGRELWDGEMWGICGEGGGTKTVTLTSTYDSNWVQAWTVDPCDNSPWTTTKLNDDLRAWTFSSTTSMGTLPDSFGLNADSAIENLTLNYIDACRFQMGSVGGTLTDLRLKVDDATISGNIKLAIYTDTTVFGSSYARTKLWADNTGQAIVNGWNSVSTSSVNLSANTYYWLCSKMSATNTVQWKGGVTGEHRWDAEAYATTWWDTIAVNSWDGTNVRKHRYLGVYTTTTLPQDRVTQSFIVVYSHAVGAVVKRKSGLVQDEDNKGVAEGGMAR
ncbi:MAG: hypothetical protein MUO91_02315 [candidate division Zixibacteria bacterium]|nr:hypothetical protein [candidate division Zixibacteria bacterium]